MRGNAGIGLLALALVGVCACEQKKEEVGQTTTTGGETEQQRAAREQQNVPGAVPVTPPQEQPKTEESAAQKAVEAAKEKGEAAKAKGEAAKAKVEAPKKARIVRKTVIVKKVIRPKEPTSTTTTTGAEMKTVPPGQQPAQPLEPGQQATPPGGMPLPTPQVAGVPYVNHSSVLGDGKSGTYTDGQGTYGGRATWGTGGGIPAYPPAPR